MSGTSRDRQPELLDEFWNALREDTTTQPANALDTATAVLVRELEYELSPPKPDDRFVARLRTRLQPASSVGSANGGVPPLPRRLTAFRPIASNDQTTSATEETRRRGFGWETLKLAAAFLSIAIVGTILVLLFRDSNTTSAPEPDVIQPASEPATETSQPVVAPAAEPVHQIAFSTYDEDGAGKQLLLADAISSAVVPLTDATDDIYVGMATWSPNGRYLAYIGPDGGGGIVLLDVISGESRGLPGTAGVYLPRWSPDGRAIVYMGTSSGGVPDLFIVDPFGGAIEGEPRQLTDNAAQELAPVWSPDGSMIAFASDDGGSYDIYVINRDGGNLRNVSNRTSDVFGPSWSPDGTKIAFNSHPGGNAEIFVADLTTGAVTNITNSPDDEIYAVWSPDGREIAYTHGAADDTEGRTNLWLMGADGTNHRAAIAEDAYASIYAAWSPDGEQIAATMQLFDQRDSVSWSLVVVNRDGSDFRVLSDRAAELDAPVWRPGTNAEVMTLDLEPEATPTIIPSHLATPSSESPAAPTGELLIPLKPEGAEQGLAIVAADSSELRPLIPEGTLPGQQSEGVWSPDGGQVAFTVETESDSDLYVVNADGSNLRQLAPTPHRDPDPDRVLTQGSPAWSPDGTKIAFASSRAWDRGGLDIYVINADGSSLRRLTDSELFESSPHWSPDGTMIAYEGVGGSADHYGNVFVMNADGSGQRRLVETIGAREPDWSPDGEWIAYSDGRYGSAVHIVRVDGTDRRDLTGVGLIAESPRWSPDGTMLAWSAHADGGSLDGIFLLNLTTGETRHISNMAGRLEWSPDGVWLVVAYAKFDASGNETGESGLYFVRTDGSDEEPLIDLPIPGYVTPDWRMADDT